MMSKDQKQFAFDWLMDLHLPIQVVRGCVTYIEDGESIPGLEDKIAEWSFRLDGDPKRIETVLNHRHFPEVDDLVIFSRIAEDILRAHLSRSVETLPVEIVSDIECDEPWISFRQS